MPPRVVEDGRVIITMSWPPVEVFRSLFGPRCFPERKRYGAKMAQRNAAIVFPQGAIWGQNGPKRMSGEGSFDSFGLRFSVSLGIRFWGTWVMIGEARAQYKGGRIQIPEPNHTAQAVGMGFGDTLRHDYRSRLLNDSLTHDHRRRLLEQHMGSLWISGPLWFWDHLALSSESHF